MQASPLASVFALLSVTLLSGCAEALDPPHTAADTRPTPTRTAAPTEDDFWAANQWSEARNTAPRRPQSISLGYLGEGVLANGVTRDSPDAPPRRHGHGLTWQEHVNAPSWGPAPSGLPSTQQRCRCDRRGAPASY